LKLSLVDASINIRAGRSVRAHTIPESVDTSPDCTPCVMTGLCDARLKAGNAMVPSAVAAVAEAIVVRNRRRVALPARKRPDMKWPPPNQRGRCTQFLTTGKS
jgi:hypothetical protein